MAAPFLGAHHGSEAAATAHLRMLLSFCHSKEHGGPASSLLAQCTGHIHTELCLEAVQPRASLSILAAVVAGIGALFNSHAVHVPAQPQLE